MEQLEERQRRLSAENAAERLRLWYRMPWEIIAWDGMVSTNRWLRHVVRDIKSNGERPLAHPVTGKDVTVSGLKQLKYGRGLQDSSESLGRNEYFAIYKAMFPDMASLYENSLIQKRVDMVENAKGSQALAATSRNVGTAASTLVTLGAGVLLCCNDRCKKPRALGVCPKTKRLLQACIKECFKAQECVDARRLGARGGSRVESWL
jgi:hypothetical protein